MAAYFDLVVHASDNQHPPLSQGTHYPRGKFIMQTHLLSFQDLATQPKVRVNASQLSSGLSTLTLMSYQSPFSLNVNANFLSFSSLTSCKHAIMVVKQCRTGRHCLCSVPVTQAHLTPVFPGTLNSLCHYGGLVIRPQFYC